MPQWHIPQEILDIIIGYAAADDLRSSYFSESCAFVSHTFHQIVLPYKFKSLTFRVSNQIRENLRDIDLIPIPEFCEAINAGDAHALSLAPLVQELCWSGRDGLLNRLMQEPFEKIINSVLSFRNLTKLKMAKCVTSPTIMEQLGKLVQLQSLHTYRCHDRPLSYDEDMVSYGALSNLQSLHTLESEGDRKHVMRYLACVPIKNLQILKSSEWDVTKAFLTTDPPVQLKELWLNHYFGVEDYCLLWNYLARVTSLTHLSLPYLRLPDGIPPGSLIFTFPELQYLHIHVALASRFADQPSMKKMEIDTDLVSDEIMPFEVMDEVRRYWQGIVFPHVEYLETDGRCDEMDEIPIEFWREFLPNVKEVR